MPSALHERRPLTLEAEITPGMTLAEAASLARAAEDAGFDRLGVSDVLWYPDCFLVQAECLRATSRIHVGSMVTNAYTRHPAIIAGALQSLHELSDGRVFCGLGVGAGLEDLGIGYPDPIATLRSAVDTIRATLTSGRLERGALAGGVPISIGTRSPQVMRLAGEMADIALVGARYLSAEVADRYRGWLADGAARVGRSVNAVEIAPRLTLCASTDGSLARRSIKRYVAHYLTLIRPDDIAIDDEQLAAITAELTGARGWYFAHDRYDPPELDELISAEMVEAFGVAGTADDCMRLVERVLDLGFTSLSFNLAAVRRPGFSMYQGLRETIEAFAPVVEHVRAASSVP